MYVDNNLLLSGAVSSTGVLSGQVVAITDTTALSTNAVDLGVARDIAEGQPLFCRVEALIAASGGTSTLFEVIASDAAAGTGNVTVIGSSGAIPVASITIGARFAFPINMRLANKGQRYLTVRYTTVGVVTAQSFVADLGIEVQDGQKMYASGFAVL